MAIQVPDHPRRDHRVVRGVGRVEQTLGVGVRVAVAARGESGEHFPELGEGHRDIRAGRLGDRLGPCRHELSRLLVAAHRRDERDRRVRRGRRLRVCELLGETPCLVGRGQRRLPMTDASGRARVEHQQPRQRAEPSFGPQPLDRRLQEVHAQVERADDEGGRPEEASGFRIEPLLCGALQAGENAGRMTERIDIRVDRDDARVRGSCVAQTMGGADQRAPHVRPRIDPPRA
jgi:hypothetical protein